MSAAAQLVDEPEVLPPRSTPRAVLADDDNRPGLCTVVPDGAYQGTVAWSSKDIFMKGLRAALEAHPERRRTKADPKTGRYKDVVKLETFMRIVEELAKTADSDTGRDVRSCKKEIADAVGCSETTVQRVGRIASRVIQCLVLIVQGRLLTELERIGPAGVWRRIPIRGQRLKQHGVPPVRAFHVPRWLRPFMAAAAIQPPPVDNMGTRRTPSDLQVWDAAHQPRRGRVAVPLPLTYNSPSQPKDGSLRSPSGPGSARTALNKKRRPPPGRELAANVRKRLPWLRSESIRRLENALKRFAESRPAWDANDIQNGIQTVRERRGMVTALTEDKIRTRPAAVLADLLRDLDPNADHPRLHDHAPDTSPEAFARAEEQLKHLSEGKCDAGWIHLDGGAVAKCPDCPPSMRATWRWQAETDPLTDEPPW